MTGSKCLLLIPDPSGISSKLFPAERLYSESSHKEEEETELWQPGTAEKHLWKQTIPVHCWRSLMPLSHLAWVIVALSISVKSNKWCHSCATAHSLSWHLQETVELIACDKNNPISSFRCQLKTRLLKGDLTHLYDFILFSYLSIWFYFLLHNSIPVCHLLCFITMLRKADKPEHENETLKIKVRSRNSFH